MKPGVYNHLTNAEYHGGPGVNKSLLDVVRRSPMHAKYALDQRAAGASNDNATPAQVFGTAFHTLLLEPAEFVKNYCLGLRQMDVPDAIEDREVLVTMLQELNATRLPKLPTGGTKDELVARLVEAGDASTVEQFAAMKLQDLKAAIAQLNTTRPGLLSVSGSRHEMADLLRANGRDVKLWSDVKDEWLKNNGQRIVLSGEQWEQLHAMESAVRDHPAANRLLSAPGAAELSAYFDDPVSGLLCRFRPDFWREDGVMVDVKTTEDAGPEEFARSVVNWRYHVQAPYYLDGGMALADAGLLPKGFKRPKAFVFLVVEKKAPYAVSVYLLTPESLELGRLEYRADLDKLEECMSSGQWPGYGDSIQYLDLPGWYLRKNLPQAA